MKLTDDESPEATEQVNNPCPSCSAPSPVVHAILNCSSQERMTCTCCRNRICKTCFELMTEFDDEVEYICDACWCERELTPEDRALAEYELLVERAFRQAKETEEKEKVN